MLLVFGVLIILVITLFFFSQNNAHQDENEEQAVAGTQAILDNTDKSSENILSETDEVQNLDGEEDMPVNLNNTQLGAKIYKEAPALTLVQGKNYKAVIKTNKGEIKVDLFEEAVPVTVNNFVFLAKEGFYNGTKSHRIIKDFMSQFGDPFTADDTMKEFWGTGDPGYKFADEPFEGEYSRGVLAMANSGPNTNGSQFFIMNQDYPLPPNYVIFGKVEDADSFATVDTIASTPVVANANGEPSSPTENVIIENITVVEE